MLIDVVVEWTAFISLFDPENGGCSFLRNVCKLLVHYTAYARR
jgi:hypothetical protein